MGRPAQCKRLGVALPGGRREVRFLHLLNYACLLPSVSGTPALFPFTFLPGPAEEVAGVDVPSVAGGRAEDDDQQVVVVSVAAGNEARPGGGSGARFHAVVTVDLQQAVRVLPDDVSGVSAGTDQGTAVLTRGDVLAKSRQAERVVSQRDQVPHRALMSFDGQTVRVFVRRPGHTEPVRRVLTARSFVNGYGESVGPHAPPDCVGWRRSSTCLLSRL